MAPSTPPPPPETSAASTAPPTTRPLLQNPPRPPSSLPFYSPPPRLPSNPNPNYPQLAPRPPHPHTQDPAQLLYPVASSGRGFLSRPAARPAQRPPFMFPYMDQGQGNPVFVRPSHLPHMIGLVPGASGAGSVPTFVKGIPVLSSNQSKVGHPSTSISDYNGHKDSRDRSKDDTSVIIRDRKVRLHEKASPYALCRSWLRNSYPEETQTQNLDTVKSLPRPLPVAAQDAKSPDKMTKDKEENGEDNDSKSPEHLSEKELLQSHIKRAKRVRSRLREERLLRITRYKTRLALLLQHFKNESPPAN